MNIVLASASPRRKELLGKIFDNFDIIPSSADETIPENMDCFKCAEYLADKKALSIFQENRESLVIGCDTVVIYENKIFGKPTDKQDAIEMLKKLSDNTHSVVTGVCIYYKEKKISFSVKTNVTFYNLSLSEIKKYVDTGEPLDKAGAYGIQGKGGLFVKKIDGDFYNVVGLPISELNNQLKNLL